MGTRCLTHVKDGDKKAVTLVTIYRQFDGYPKGHGQELKDLFGKTKIINGIGAKQKSPNFANTMSCFAAQLIGRLKEGIGNIYIYPADSNDCGEEYTYTLYESEGEVFIVVYDVYDKKILYDGKLSNFNAE